MDQEEIKRPSLIWSLTEGGRALFELSTYFPYRFFSRYDQSTDKHPVLILPGFMATDFSTLPLRSFVNKLGYEVYGWGEGRNLGNEEYLDMLLEKLDQIYDKHRMPISIIGWSLGGVYARQLAKAKPDLVRQVITLGSPFKAVTKNNNAKWIHDMINKDSAEAEINQELLDDLPNPAPVPTTAIYSKQDGVVPWIVCREQEENDIHQNIEVRGSHLGLGVNPTVLEIIEDRLQYSEENWVPFSPCNKIENLLFYPSI